MSGEHADERILLDVIKELKDDPRFRDARICAVVDVGNVTLVGGVETSDVRFASEAAARRVRGVVEIVNNIRIEGPAARTRSDLEIAVSIRRAHFWDARVPHERIRACVSGGVVTIEGSVEHAVHSESAERSARGVEGVREIRNLVSIDAPHSQARKIYRAIVRGTALRVSGDTVTVTHKIEKP